MKTRDLHRGEGCLPVGRWVFFGLGLFRGDFRDTFGSAQGLYFFGAPSFREGTSELDLCALSCWSECAYFSLHDCLFVLSLFRNISLLRRRRYRTMALPASSEDPAGDQHIHSAAHTKHHEYLPWEIPP